MNQTPNVVFPCYSHLWGHMCLPCSRSAVYHGQVVKNDPFSSGSGYKVLFLCLPGWGSGVKKCCWWLHRVGISAETAFTEFKWWALRVIWTSRFFWTTRFAESNPSSWHRWKQINKRRLRHISERSVTSSGNIQISWIFVRRRMWNNPPPQVLGSTLCGGNGTESTSDFRVV